MTHVCDSKLTIIGSDNGLSPGRRQAIIWTNAGIFLIRPLGTKFIEILIEPLAFSFKKIHLKMSSGKWRPFCLGLNELTRGHGNDLTVWYYNDVRTHIYIRFKSFKLSDWLCIKTHFGCSIIIWFQLIRILSIGNILLQPLHYPMGQSSTGPRIAPQSIP